LVPELPSRSITPYINPPSHTVDSESRNKECRSLERDLIVTWYRSFDEKDELISHLSRSSIDVLSKQHAAPFPWQTIFLQSIVPSRTETTFRDQVDLSDWALIKALKPKLDIQ
jgi:hypothetical protein